MLTARAFLQVAADAALPRADRKRARSSDEDGGEQAPASKRAKRESNSPQANDCPQVQQWPAQEQTQQEVCLSARTYISGIFSHAVEVVG